MGQRLLGQAQLIGQLLLCQTVLLAGLRDARAQVFEKLLVVRIHGREIKKLTMGLTLDLRHAIDFTHFMSRMQLSYFYSKLLDSFLNEVDPWHASPRQKSSG